MVAERHSVDIREIPDSARVQTWPVFREMDREIISEILASGTCEIFKPGVDIQKPSEQHDCFGIILYGNLDVYRYSPTGRKQHLGRIVVGETVNEVVGHMDSNPHTVTLLAKDETILLWISPDKYVSLFRKYPSFSLNILRIIKDRIRMPKGVNALVENYYSNFVLSRLAKELLRWAEEYGEKLPDGSIKLNHGTKHTDVADCIGTSRESVSKSLAKLRRENLLTSNNQHKIIIIRDIEALQRMVAV